MISSQIRANARQALTGKWGKGALLVLCFGVISFGISFILNLIPLIGSIASAIISLPLSFGFTASFMKLKRGEEVGYTEFLNIGFSNIGKVWGILGNTILKMIVPIILVVVFAIIIVSGTVGSVVNDLSMNFSASMPTVNPTFSILRIIGFLGYIISLIYTVVKGYLYSLSYYILFDNPNKSGKEIVEESASLMKGNRWRYVWLGFTFIGWAILAAIPFYIGFFWLIPYIQVAMVCFYEDLANKSDSNPIVEE